MLIVSLFLNSGDNDSQTDCSLGDCHGNHEYGKDLAVQGLELFSKGHQIEVDCIQHQLDRQ